PGQGNTNAQNKLNRSFMEAHRQDSPPPPSEVKQPLFETGSCDSIRSDGGSLAPNSSLTISAKPVGVGAASQPVIGDFRIDTRTEIWITGRGEQNCAGDLGAALCVER